MRRAFALPIVKRVEFVDTIEHGVDKQGYCNAFSLSFLYSPSSTHSDRRVTISYESKRLFAWHHSGLSDGDKLLEHSDLRLTVAHWESIYSLDGLFTTHHLGEARVGLRRQPKYAKVGVGVLGGPKRGLVVDKRNVEDGPGGATGQAHREPLVRIACG